MDDIFERSIGLIGKENFEVIKDKVVAIFGLGGVGGTALESLARTGFEEFLIIDFDLVSSSNINRQILYTSEDIGKAKVEAAKNKLLKINKNISVETFSIKAQDFDFNRKIDFVIDAIDDVNGKLFIAQKCEENSIPYIICLGMANRFDPSKVCISTLNKTYNDPLAKKVRHLFKESGLIINKVHVVFSLETAQSFDGKLNSIMTVPSSAGLNIAYYLISYFVKGE